MMNRSPNPASKISSGGTLESLQPRMVAKGRWPFARSASTSMGVLVLRGSPRRKRALPSIKRASASSAPTGQSSSLGTVIMLIPSLSVFQELWLISYVWEGAMSAYCRGIRKLLYSDVRNESNPPRFGFRASDFEFLSKTVSRGINKNCRCRPPSAHSRHTRVRSGCPRRRRGRMIFSISATLIPVAYGGADQRPHSEPPESIRSRAENFDRRSVNASCYPDLRPRH